MIAEEKMEIEETKVIITPRKERVASPMIISQGRLEEDLSDSKLMEHENPSPIRAQSSKKKHKISDYSWMHYDIEKDPEINYLEDFLDLCGDQKISKIKLGLATTAEKKRSGKQDEANGENEQKMPPMMSSSNRKLIDVANNLKERLLKFGGLYDDSDPIKKRNNKTGDFYDDDDPFIDDGDDRAPERVAEQIESFYNDYFIFEGDEKSFKKSKYFAERVSALAARKRRIKLKEQQKQKKELEKRNRENELRMLQNSNISEIKARIEREEKGALS